MDAIKFPTPLRRNGFAWRQVQRRDAESRARVTTPVEVSSLWSAGGVSQVWPPAAARGLWTPVSHDAPRLGSVAARIAARLGSAPDALGVSRGAGRIRETRLAAGYGPLAHLGTAACTPGYGRLHTL
jgi:hypothetical protein